MGYGTYMQFVLNLAITLVSATGAYTGVSYADRLKRRPVLWIGTLGCAILLAINAGLTAAFAPHTAQDADGNFIDPSPGLAKGALAAYFLCVPAQNGIAAVLTRLAASTWCSRSRTRRCRRSTPSSGEFTIPPRPSQRC